MKRPDNPSLAAYAEALAKELAAGKSFPGPDPALVEKLRQADAHDPNADLKTAAAILELEKECESAALEREDNAKTQGKYRNSHTAGKYGGK